MALLRDSNRLLGLSEIGFFFFLQVDSRESIRANRPDSCCESPGHPFPLLGAVRGDPFPLQASFNRLIVGQRPGAFTESMLHANPKDPVILKILRSY